jgi:hypothetical protein
VTTNVVQRILCENDNFKAIGGHAHYRAKKGNFVAVLWPFRVARWLFLRPFLTKMAIFKSDFL